MKKTILFLLSILTLLSFTACGNSLVKPKELDVSKFNYKDYFYENIRYSFKNEEVNDKEKTRSGSGSVWIKLTPKPDYTVKLSDVEYTMNVKYPWRIIDGQYTKTQYNGATATIELIYIMDTGEYMGYADLQGFSELYYYSLEGEFNSKWIEVEPEYIRGTAVEKNK